MELSIKGFQLSPSQKYLWSLQSDTNTAFYCFGIFNIKVEFNPVLLKKAIERVIENHEILRTSLETSENFLYPLQNVEEEVSFVWKESDISGFDDTEKAEYFENLRKQTHFEEEQKSKSHIFEVIRTTEKSFVLAIKILSYFTDQKGLFNLANEISKSYQLLKEKKEYETEIPQFIDISDWQNQTFESEETKFGKDYWKGFKELFENQPSLPFENEQCETDSFDLKEYTLKIPDELVENLVKATKENEDTLKAWFLACWIILLYKFTESRDLVVGVNFNGRNFPELEDTLGNLSKYLPILFSSRQNLRFAEIRNILEERITESSDLQDSFFWGTLVNEETKRNRQSFWDYCFDLHNTFEEKLEKGNIFELIDYFNFDTFFRLYLSCFLKNNASHIRIKYDSSFYSCERIETLSEQFFNLLSDTAINPEIALNKINVITKAESDFVLNEVNVTQYNYETKDHFHQMFEKQVINTPNSIAVVCENNQITYIELNKKANQLADFLLKLGVKPDDIIGLHLNANIDFMISLLAVAKAGAGYLPLDPINPQARLKFMVDDAQPKVIITQKGSESSKFDTEIQEIAIDDFNFNNYKAENHSVIVSGKNLAYTMYTSGSTGMPKGVMILREGLANYLLWCLSKYHLDLGKVVPVHSSIGFDLSITGLLTPLLVGQRVLLFSNNLPIDSLIDTIKSEDDISFIKLTPSQFQVLGMLLPKNEIGKINTLIIGGEALHGEIFNNRQDLLSNTNIINEYGPTETVVGCITYERKGNGIGKGAIPIGRPIRNMEVYILDENMEPVPIGARGEIYLGGIALARGYWQRADLTAESFVPHPFSQKEGQRLYRTGDIGRYRNDGEIEYVGRKDEQVKVRGYRIELGEIESQVKGCEGIRDAVVEVKRNELGQAGQVICYVVREEGQEEVVSRLREYLRERLPEYMIPERYVEVEGIPLTGNGKVDRGALAEIEKKRRRSESEGEVREEELNPIEEIVKGIWEEILEVEVKTKHSNFFELGGHSLLATRIIARINNDLDINLSMLSILQKPTIKDLSESVFLHLEESMSETELAQLISQVSE